ncbi:hypothetical protein [Herbiconiux sp. UC225_62]|uniref:hypothetical protein n=1 Tax=Herbiconiux sp. UC225_62 TaxID=3350168 RepID=UPI0036D38A8C
MSERVGGEQFVSRAAGVRVRESDLGAKALIGSGTATDVYRLDSFTVPGHDGGLAYVRTRDRSPERWNPAVLSRLVALRLGLDAGARATLDGVAAWPTAVVEDDDGEAVGCLMPLAAHPFYYLPSEEKSAGKLPQNAKWLVVAPKRARRAGAAAVAERDLVARCTVLARVALLVEILHRHGVVFGDLSEKSVLYGIGEVAEAFVIGCEGAAFAGEGTLQRNSAGWAAPETVAAAGEIGETGETGETDVATWKEPSVQTVATDRYKLGLLVLRVLAPAGDGLERSRDAGRVRSVLDADGQRMMTRALGDVPDDRPSASEWYDYLRGMIIQSLDAPVIRSVVVSPALVAEGDEVRLEVEVTGAQQLTIEMPGRADIRRDIGGRIVSERFTARQSGRIGVRAANAHGEVVAVSNVVRVLPVPTPTRIPLASPQVPAGLGVLPDLASLEAALGISTPPTSGGGGDGGGAGGGIAPFERVAELRERLDADASPVRDLMRFGIEAERVSRERLFPSFEEFLNDITPTKRED